MTFADLVAGDAIFLDANTFIYHFGPDPVLGPPCSQLLQRIENQEIGGFASIHLLGEICHKLMTIEANALFGWSMTGMGEDKGTQLFLTLFLRFTNSNFTS